MVDILDVIQEEVEWTFGDWPEDHGISSSDVSAVVNSIVNRLEKGGDFTPPEVVRSLVHCDMNRVLENR